VKPPVVENRGMTSSVNRFVKPLERPPWVFELEGMRRNNSVHGYYRGGAWPVCPADEGVTDRGCSGGWIERNCKT
jgi:hypothetical protein